MVSLPQSPDSPVPESLWAAALSSQNIPSLPMDLWPSCFSAPRLAGDNSHYEVMLNESAWDRKGSIWKFYPSVNSAVIASKISELKTIHPFSSDEGLVEDLDTLQEYVDMWIIDDGIVDHEERRTFRDEHPDASKYFTKHSKLRRNAANYIPMVIESINRTLGDKKVETKLSWLWAMMDSLGYNNQELSWKVQIIGGIELAILMYLTDLVDTLNAK